MELRDLRYLAALALAGNFSAAAGSPGLNSSTISRRIARLNLEDEFKVVGLLARRRCCLLADV